MSGVRGGESAGSNGPPGRSGASGVASPSANPVGRDTRTGRAVAGWARTSSRIAVSAALLVACALGSTAFAQTTPQSGTMAPGGSTYTSSPVIRKVRCVAACASRKRLRGGSTARIEGRYLAGVTKVTFHGSVGRRDDRRVAVRPGTSTRRLRVAVPLSAVSGPVSVQVSRSVKSRRSKTVKILPAPEIEPNPVLSAVPGTGQNGTPRLETATSRTKFYFAGSNVRFSWRVTHPSPVNVTVDLLRTDGSVAWTWN